MTEPYRIQDLERQLRAPVPEPPEELLAALREDIPSDVASREPADPEPPRRTWRLAAAAVFLVVVGGVIADRVRRQVPLETADPGRAVATPSRPEPETSAEPRPAAPPATEEGSGAGRRPDQQVEQPAEPPAEGRLERRLEQSREPLAEVPKPREEKALDGDRKDRVDQASPRESRSESELAERLMPPPAAPAASPPPPSPEPEVADSPVAFALPSPDPTPAAPAPVLDDLAVAGRAAKRLREVGPVDAAAAPSTGGTAEPNDRPYGDMFFESAGVNPFIDTEDDRLSTFGLDVDTGSYTMARSYLERGHLPPAEAVRVEEFVNFFSYGDPPPRRGDFALSAEAAPSPFAEGPRYQVLRFGVRGREVERAARRPAVLTFVVDVSGSMGREDRLGLVRRSLELLLDQLGADDRVGLVVYGSRGQVLLEPSGDHEAIRRAIGRLVPEGSTNAEEGLVLGYELARRYFREGAINRVVLCSDGVANVGRTGPDSILERIAAAAEEGIELTTVGFGMGNYNDVLMEQLANRGDGRYAYVDSFAEARRLFVDDLTGTLETIATDAKVQVEFDPEVVSRYRLLGYENRDIADERFRDDTVDAGEIGAGHSVSAVYEIKLAPGARRRDRLARISLRYRSVASGEVEEMALDLRVGDAARSWEGASPGLRLASIVAELGEILRRSYWAREGDLADLLRRAQELSPAFAGDAKVAELVGLIGKAERLSRPDDSD